MTDDPILEARGRAEPRVAPWDRYARLRQVAALDPYRDRQRIHRITAGYEFPFDYQRSLELALFRTYCSPTISAVLSESGEFAHRPQKRYDDTAILMAEMVEHGVTSDRGGEAVRNINRMHGMYEISNEDMLYVLSTFVFDPIDWIDRYGWRRLHPNERLAAFHYYIEVGQKMGITDLPETMADFHRFRLDYESRNFVYAETNHEIGTYTVDLFAAWFPRPLRPLVRRGVYAMLTDQMAAAFGFPAGSPRLRALLETGLRARSRAVRLLPPRQRSRTTRDPRNRTYPQYPDGYRPRDLGTPRVKPTVAARRRRLAAAGRQ